MLPEPPSSPATPLKSSSVLYAIGRLSAQVEDLKDLPSRVTASIAPTLAAHGVMLNDHSVRLVKLERQQWLWMGGGAVILTIATLAATTTLPVFHP